MNIATIYYSAILGRVKNTSLPLLSSLRKVKITKHLGVSQTSKKKYNHITFAFGCMPDGFTT